MYSSLNSTCRENFLVGFSASLRYVWDYCAIIPLALPTFSSLVAYKQLKASKTTRPTSLHIKHTEKALVLVIVPSRSPPALAYLHSAVYYGEIGIDNEVVMVSSLGPWFQNKKASLPGLGQSQGTKGWSRLSRLIHKGTPNQSREVCWQIIKPNVSHQPVAIEEREFIEKLVSQMGKRCAEIARRLPGRSGNTVKKWMYESINRRRLSVARLEEGVPKGPGFDGSAQLQQTEILCDSGYGSPELSPQKSCSLGMLINSSADHTIWPIHSRTDLENESHAHTEQSERQLALALESAMSLTPSACLLENHVASFEADSPVDSRPEEAVACGSASLQKFTSLKNWLDHDDNLISAHHEETGTSSQVWNIKM